MAKNDPKIASCRKYAPKMQNAKSRDIYVVYICVRDTILDRRNKVNASYMSFVRNYQG